MGYVNGLKKNLQKKKKTDVVTSHTRTSHALAVIYYLLQQNKSYYRKLRNKDWNGVYKKKKEKKKIGMETWGREKRNVKPIMFS